MKADSTTPRDTPVHWGHAHFDAGEAADIVAQGRQTGEAMKKRQISKRERLQALTDNPLWRSIIGRILDGEWWIEMVEDNRRSVPRFRSNANPDYGGYCSWDFYHWLRENDVI